ncbi:hypothetical protein YC2023_067660 [Brassica napus]
MASTKTKKAIAAHDQEHELPWEIIEEILSHVPPISLVRFRTVCKRWNALFNDETFINNHKLTFRFILITKSKIYSFLLCSMDKGAAVWNPWLKQSRWIKAQASQPSF